jgi:hypothetical protein
MGTIGATAILIVTFYSFWSNHAYPFLKNNTQHIVRTIGTTNHTNERAYLHDPSKRSSWSHMRHTLTYYPRDQRVSSQGVV